MKNEKIMTRITAIFMVALLALALGVLAAVGYGTSAQTAKAEIFHDLVYTPDYGNVQWTDKCSTDGYWELTASDSEYYSVTIKGNSSEEAAGEYQWSDLDADKCYAIGIDYGNLKYQFVSGSCTVSINDGIVSLVGDFYDEDSAHWYVDITGNIPLAPGTQWLNGETIEHNDTIWIVSWDFPMDFSEYYDRVDYIARRGAFYFEYTLSGYYETFYVPAEGHRDAPIGIELVSGTGTEDDPYVFKGIFDEQAEVEEVAVGLKLLTKDMIPEDEEFFTVDDLEDYVAYEDLDAWSFTPDLEGTFYVIYRARTQEEGGKGFWWVKFENGKLTGHGSNSPFNTQIRLWLDNSVYYYTVAPHVHDYATAWSNDGSTHWHACTVEGDCTAPKADEAAHTYGTEGVARYTCTVCGYEDATLKAQVLAQDDQDAAAAAAALIAAIGTVEYTAESKDKIDAAREAYDSLTVEQKALLGNNYETLTTAEATYAALGNNAETGNEGLNGSTEGFSAEIDIKDEKGGLSAGAIAGIVIGSVFGAAILAAVALFLLNKFGILKLAFVDKASKAVVAGCTKCADKIKALFKKKPSDEPKTEDTPNSPEGK